MLSEQSQTQPKAISIFTAKRELCLVGRAMPHGAGRYPHSPTKDRGADCGTGFSYGKDPPSARPSSEWSCARVALPVLSAAAACRIACGGDAMTVIGHTTPRGAKLHSPGKHSWTSAACWKPSGSFSGGRGWSGFIPVLPVHVLICPLSCK